MAEGLCAAAENHPNLWEAFGLLRSALGDTSYPAALRAAFEGIGRAATPEFYRTLWTLDVSGFLNLNIDNFAVRAFSETHENQAILQFNGVEAARFATAFRTGKPFVANLHGVLDDQKSWVFTKSDLDALMQAPGYEDFIQTCFAARTVLFIGVSAEDVAAGGHLDRIAKLGIDVKGHFWLTTRNDQEIVVWAEQAGIRPIFYHSEENDHSQVDGFLQDLRKYIPKEVIAPPVIPLHAAPSRQLPEPDQLRELSANDLRKLLNSEAVRILTSSSQSRLSDYADFWGRYGEAIYRAWWFNPASDFDNVVFDLKLTRNIAKGSFGRVFEAVSPKGERVAVKILHETIKEEPEMLGGFRRGVAAMKILSDRKVPGMVPYLDAWEIPACTVMEMIDGPNLEQAIEAGYLDSWQDKMRVALDVTSIIRAAHQVPERVLHRDIRPANIMLKNYDIDPENWEVVVLDFDLSWHRDASGYSVNLSHSTNGYLAPEQVDPAQKNLTRNSLVDSFGLAMTLYFMFSRTHPLLTQHQHANWKEILGQRISSQKCLEWTSIPRRLARLIEKSTKDQQSHRWDMTRIHGEISRLQECLNATIVPRSAELIAEEIASQCEFISPYYEWNGNKLSATAEIKRGFTVTILGDESEQSVSTSLVWSNAGEGQFENVRKFIGPASDRAAAELKGGGWSIRRKRVTFNECEVEATLKLGAIGSRKAIGGAAASISRSIEKLRLG